MVSPAPSDVPVAAVGSTTAEGLHERGWTPLVVGRGGASELVAELAAQHDLRGRRVLFPAASRAGPALEESLRACGAVVHR
ncbi:MAG: HemD protein, partial [Gammaproteobacteria bacterium]|nr:HemD protein [Gemmatimonadota bacterium]NIU73704.1 HemD protein [Gammaproteobacteria bacterium]